MSCEYIYNNVRAWVCEMASCWTQNIILFLGIAISHTHYTVGGKCIHHQHIMDAASTLREFDARFLYGNCELFIDSCVIGQMLVVYWRGT